MRIAHFVGTLKKDDGVGRVILKLIEYAKHHGHKSVVVTGYPEDPKAFPVRIFKTPSLKFPLYKDYQLGLPFINSFKKDLNRFDPQVVHLHSPDTIALAAVHYAKEKNIPIIVTHHTDFVKYLPYYHLKVAEPVVWAILRELYKKMDRVSTPSEVMAEDLRKHGISKVVATPWGIDPKNFDPKFRSGSWRRKLTGGKNVPIVLFLSRLVWEKDIDVLAKVYKSLQDNKIPFQMVVAGDGPARKELQKLMPKAKFLGFVKGLHLSTAYASADVFLFPSTTETFGNVTLEAMASGIVPVVANAGGSKSIVEHGKTGFTSKPKNVRSFYDNVMKLLNDPSKYKKMRAAGLEHAENFTWEKVLKRFFRIYSDMIKEHK